MHIHPLMFLIRICFYSIISSIINAFPQINFYLTDEFNQSNIIFEHHCLLISASKLYTRNHHEIISFCLSNITTKLNIQEDDDTEKFTFDALYKQNITSEQLYQWSASMDLIEEYEYYLNSTPSSMSTILFYNCSSPRFGPQCQYSFLDFVSHDLTLDEIFDQFYQSSYATTDLTCYLHLNCNRGPKDSCLDWTEICDGYIDCINDQIDEKYCWEVQINECGEDEYRCHNGQCISKKFYFDDPRTRECLDQTDESWDSLELYHNKPTLPIIRIEDIMCAYRSNEGNPRMSSSCEQRRNHLLRVKLFNEVSNSVLDICEIAIRCIIYRSITHPLLCQSCGEKTCAVIANETCPDLIFMPVSPIAYGHVYTAYFTKIGIRENPDIPDLICYNENLCGGFKSNVTLISFQNKTCRRPQDFPIFFNGSVLKPDFIQLQLRAIFSEIRQCNTIIYDDLTICNSSLMYHCINTSKCISKFRLCDGIVDCDYRDDEQCSLINNTCSPIESDLLAKCRLMKRCISISKVGNSACDCRSDRYGICDDENFHQCDPHDLDSCNSFTKNSYIRQHISFPIICDGYIELVPVLIDEESHTDETECQYWKCNNTYTRCNGHWNCLDGADEVDCDSFSLIHCPPHHHICTLPRTFELTCLPIHKANDGHIDCLGAMDEPKRCRSQSSESTFINDFYCGKIRDTHCGSTLFLCRSSCIPENEDLFCNLANVPKGSFFCDSVHHPNSSHIVKALCSGPFGLDKMKMIHFSLEQTTRQNLSNPFQQSSSIAPLFQSRQSCHRGFPLQVSNNMVCLCPSSYYGDHCQYQNQRITFTLQFQTYSDSRRTLFSLVVLLIDNSNERIIHSSKQLTYLHLEHCSTKFNFYLLYSTKPKDITRNYSIHIDIYVKTTFGYRGSLFTPLKYSFLPVHRIALLLTIPRNNKTLDECQDHQCDHGQCMKYAGDSNNRHFCKCNQGWSGKYCSIPIKCTCSSDSLCLGIDENNRSICICPPHKWGLRCLLQNQICQSNKNFTICLNNGQCIPADKNMITNRTFYCICPKGFSGERCEIEDAKIIVSFDKKFILPEIMLVYFIEIQKNQPIRNGSTFQIIPLYQEQIIITWSQVFHIVFTELSKNNYYLIHVQKTYNRSNIIRKLINSSDRCGYFSEYVNETIIKYPLIRRIKYYHIPCQNVSLSCFYDQDHFCLCNDFGLERVANCFEFNSSLSHNCFRLSNCENNAQCIQDTVHCPKTSKCICRDCSYGALCQFSSSLFDLSLDGILGYHIQPNQNIHDQPSIVKITLALVTIMIVIGLINGILSLLAFKTKKTRQVGCGYYLLGSTLTTLFTSLMLGLKFSILVLAQMSVIKNRSFLVNQCYLFDYLLQFCLNMDKWLNGCIAIERAFNIIKGTSFDKKKSKNLAKYVIGFLLLLTISTTIYDPIHRRLVNDNSDDEHERMWCIVSYSSNLQKFNQFLQIFHFFVPLLMNIFSSVIIVILATKIRRTVQHDQSYKRLLYEQIQQHRQILIAPIAFITLALPRLIISFVAGCMKSKSSPWLFLVGYLISFVPPMLTFIVFVLPSKLYTEEFKKTVKQYRQTLRRRLQLISRE